MKQKHKPWQNMVPFKPVVFIQVHLTNSPLRDNRQVFVVVVFTLKFLVVIRLVVIQDSVVIKTVNENLLLSSSSSVPSISGRMYQRSLSGRRQRLISDSHYLLLEYLASLEN